MKKIILLITTALLLYISSSALEPVRIGLNYPTGANFKVQLVDYTDPGNPVQKFPLAPNTFFEINLIPNTSGVVSFVVGEGDPDWGGILPNQINENVIIDVRVGTDLVAQFDFMDMITTQAATGNGDILNDGFTSSGGVTFSDTTNITNDFLFGSAKLDRLSAVDETKFFFDHSKAAFRTGIVGTDSWNENNIGNFSFATGKDTKASGVGAVALGVGTIAPSYGEVAIGSYNTVYTPGSTSAIVNTDRAFVIGNGTAGTPSDAFIIQKNGNMTVGGSLTVLGATITNSALVVGGTTIDPNTGNLIVAGTTTMNGNASVTGANTFTVGNGLTTLDGGLTVSAGTVTLPANAIVDAEVSNVLTVDGGTINNTPVGAGGASTGAFTTLNATTATTTGLVTAGNGLTVSAGTVTLPANAIVDAEVANVLTVDGGTINNTIIGAGGAAAGTFTTVNATTATTTGLVTAGNGLTVTTGATTLNGNTSVTGANTLTVGTGATTLGGDVAVGGMLSQGFTTAADLASLTAATVNVIEYTAGTDVANGNLPGASGTILYIHCSSAITSFLGQALAGGEVVTVANFNGTWRIVSIN